MNTVAAIGSAVTAVASMIAAIAAWRSASGSLAASRDAKDALALIITPNITLDLVFDRSTDGRTAAGLVKVRVVDLMWPATTLKIEIRHRDGHTARDERERLDVGDSWTVPLTGVAVDGADALDGFRKLVEEVVVTFSDERGIGRYERRLEPHPSAPYVERATRRLN